MQVIPDGEPKKVKISAKEFQAKYRSKREIYNFLACDVGVYLPPFYNVTIYFLKELMNGKKKMIHANNHRTISIPQYVKFTKLSLTTQLFCTISI